MMTTHKQLIRDRDFSIFRNVLSSAYVGRSFQNFLTTPNVISTLQNLIYTYAKTEYHYIPVTVEALASEDVIAEMCATRFVHHLNKYDYIFEEAAKEASPFLKLSTAEFYKHTSNKSGNNTETIDESKTVTHTGTDTTVDDGTTSDFNMTEQAPIDSTTSIRTPNMKMKSDTDVDNTRTVTKNLTDTDEFDANNANDYEENVTTSDERVSPYYAEKFIEVMKRYSIPQIITNCFRKIVYELNCSI